MSEVIKGFQTEQGILRYDYQSLENIEKPDYAAGVNEVGYIANRPMYRTSNYTKTIETISMGAHCIYDFSTYPGSFYKSYLTAEGLEDETSGIFFEQSVEGKLTNGTWRAYKPLFVFEVLDSVNLIGRSFNTEENKKAIIYIIHDYTLLNEELKAQMTSNGVWLLVSGSETEANMRNYTFTQYAYTKLDNHYLQPEVITKYKLNKALSNIENYYSSLSLAMADINNGTADNRLDDITEAKVQVFTGDLNQKVVILLDDLTESTQINVNKNIDLVLNGKTLNFTGLGAGLNFAQDTESCIYGLNGTINKTVTDIASNDNTIIVNSTKFKVEDGTYIFDGTNSTYTNYFKVTGTCEQFALNNCNIDITNLIDQSKETKAIQSAAKSTTIKKSVINVNSNNISLGFFGLGEVTIEDSEFNVKTSSDVNAKNAIAINLQGGNLYIKNSEIIADAPGSGAGASASQGIYTLKNTKAFIDNCYITATHSGVAARGELYVNKGTYTGYSHGGFYFSNGINTINYINDATIRCGNYEGSFPNYDQPYNNHSPLAAFFIGGGNEEYHSNMIVHMDGCTIEGIDDMAFIILGTSGETNNKLYISNSVITKGSYVRVDNDTHKLYVGMNMNITENMVCDNAGVLTPERAQYSNNIYRYHYENTILTNYDYNALIKTISKTSVEMKPLTINGTTYNGSSAIDMTEQIISLIDASLDKIDLAEEAIY